MRLNFKSNYEINNIKLTPNNPAVNSIVASFIGTIPSSPDDCLTACFVWQNALLDIMLYLTSTAVDGMVALGSL